MKGYGKGGSHKGGAKDSKGGGQTMGSKKPPATKKGGK